MMTTFGTLCQGRNSSFADEVVSMDDDCITLAYFPADCRQLQFNNLHASHVRIHGFTVVVYAKSPKSLKPVKFVRLGTHVV